MTKRECVTCGSSSAVWPDQCIPCQEESAARDERNQLARERQKAAVDPIKQVMTEAQLRGLFKPHES